MTETSKANRLSKAIKAIKASKAIVSTNWSVIKRHYTLLATVFSFKWIRFL